MRPLVLCEHDAMTFTASGDIFTHFLLDRGKTFELFVENLLDFWATWHIMYQVTLLFGICLIGEQPF